MEERNEPVAHAGAAGRPEAETAPGRPFGRIDRATHARLVEFSHELRGKLNAINGWADVLEGCVSGDELAARALETIKRNAVAQAKIIRDMVEGIERAVEREREDATDARSDPPLRMASGSRLRR
jgi:hypothetical protein